MLKATAKLGRNLRSFILHTHRLSSSPYQHYSQTFFPHHHNPKTPFSAFYQPTSYLSFTDTHHRCQYSTTIETPAANSDSNDEVEPIDLWEDEDESEPEIGDGGDGGGVVLQNCPWGEKVLSIARDVLLQFGDNIEIFAFKTSPQGYIYVRLDRLCNEYGCPSLEDIQNYNREYKKRLDEAGAVGDIPSDLAIEVSSPGADRLLRIPNDLERFKDMAMRVKYVEQGDLKSSEKERVFYLESIEAESESCVWRLADVKENRDPLSKGRPMTRKQKDWRLELPYKMLKQVTLYIDYQ
ncbi:uncharacterized protein [Rutidosis leptorrhynchoides]|uniref:uncharacterized protein n=1 Tax=Rutidosis leptorrhynchoides TaxID=125765 RepID=UPI003A99AF7E